MFPMLSLDVAAAPRPTYPKSPQTEICCTMWLLLKEFFHYLREEKKWWLYPLVFMLLGLGALLVFGSSSGLGWAIYPFM